MDYNSYSNIGFGVNLEYGFNVSEKTDIVVPSSLLIANQEEEYDLSYLQIPLTLGVKYYLTKNSAGSRLSARSIIKYILFSNYQGNSQMNFPEKISFTITNSCNLRCRMCGQWSEEGYIKTGSVSHEQELKLADWKRLVDEIAGHDIDFFLIRGGEPFLFPGIIELLEYINSKGISISIDTNGTMLKKYAEDIVRIGNIHLTISVDGPEEIHDQVRGAKGCSNKIKEGVALLRTFEKSCGKKISTSICFTISHYSYKGLGDMPDVARSLLIDTIVIVPYYYFPEEVGKIYEQELREHLGCTAFSWHGFHHEDSGVDFTEFQKQFRKYLAGLNGIYSYPYLPLSEDEYKLWFNDPISVVKTSRCNSIEKLIDIQPNGNANFCVDFPDYSFGNIKDATIEELWNSEPANKFRELRREQPLAVCHRCGAKYMSEDAN